MSKIITMRCKKCDSVIISGDTNGLPNGVGFKLQDGSILNLCQKCIMDLGKRDDAGKAEFFKEIGVEV